jgi:molybdate transport system substrate-binding protein
MAGLALLLVLALASAPAGAADLIVSAAASLTNAFRDAGRLFEANHPEHKVVFNFASSDVLLSQVAKGAPVDVLATADDETMDRAEKLDLIAPGSRRVLLYNALALVVPASQPLRLADLRSLEDRSVRRIAIGNPASVPAGRYAREALETAGSWARLEPKLIFGQNVRQVLDYLARGEVDAAVVYATDAAIMPGKVRIAAVLPTTTPIAYPLAIVQATRNRTAAAAFVQWLQSEPVRAIFSRYGFRPAEASG